MTGGGWHILPSFLAAVLLRYLLVVFTHEVFEDCDHGLDYASM